MQVSNQNNQLYAAPQSKVLTTSLAQKPTETTAQQEPTKIITLADRFITGTPFSENSQEVFLGTPEDMVHETVDDIVRARENGKGHWCGTPMVMDIMRAHSRFDTMVSKQDQKTLEGLRDYIVNEMRGEPSEEVRDILHRLYQSVDKAVELPEASATTGPDKDGFYTVGSSKDSKELKSLDHSADYQVEKMVNSKTKTKREQVHKNYGNLREVYKNLKQEVKEEATEQRVEQLLEDLENYRPPHVGFGINIKF